MARRDQRIVEVKNKICSKCKEEKSVEEFYRHGARGHQGYCKRCANEGRWKNGRFKDEEHKKKVLEANRRSYAKHSISYRQRTAIRNAEYKLKGIQYLGGKCSSPFCTVDHPAVLQFHHRDPDLKSFNISTALCAPNKYPWNIMQQELNKCDLFCGNCHDFYHNRRAYSGFSQETWEVRRAQIDGEDFHGQKKALS